MKITKEFSFIIDQLTAWSWLTLVGRGLFYMQASLSMAAAAHDCSNSHPSLLVKTNENGVVNEVFLICKKTIISPIKGVEAPIVI